MHAPKPQLHLQTFGTRPCKNAQTHRTTARSDSNAWEKQDLE